MAATELPGVYKVPRYAARARGFATNKPPTAPYRGVSRPQIVMVMEGLMDKAAARLGIDRVEIRRRNTIQPEDFPYTGVNGITYEPGSYVEALERCLAQTHAAGWWDARTWDDGILRGIGIVNFSERTAYGTATMGLRKMQMTPGFEVAHVRMDASGDVVVTSGYLRARPGARDHVRADSRRSAWDLSGQGEAPAGRHRRRQLRLGNVWEPVPGHRRRRGRR